MSFGAQNQFTNTVLNALTTVEATAAIAMFSTMPHAPAMFAAVEAIVNTFTICVTQATPAKAGIAGSAKAASA